MPFKYNQGWGVKTTHRYIKMAWQKFPDSKPRNVVKNMHALAKRRDKNKIARQSRKVNRV